MAEKALHRGNIKRFGAFWLLTIVLGVIFLLGTAREWHGLIYEKGLTISTNLFGTTFYSLVGLHAFHVIVGATGLTIIMIFTAHGLCEAGTLRPHQRFCDVLAFCRCHLGRGVVGGLFHYAIRKS